MRDFAFIEDKEYVLSEEETATIRKVLALRKQSSLECLPIAELDGKTFFVRDYQRGYRWGEDEVKNLLNDIDSISDFESGYCMQPLVVKKIEDDSVHYQKKLGEKECQGCGHIDFELVDGQQRLSTIWLLISYLKKKSNLKYEKVSYSIYYEINRPVDSHYINKAERTITDWFESHEENLEEFEKKLEKLFFIWYESKERKTPQKLFRSINEGKIELTNAELFKALLLNPDNEIGADWKTTKIKLDQIAFEWDGLENSLRNDDFWYFLSKDNVDRNSRSTRIDYVLELYARQKNKYGLSPDKDRFSFLVIQRMLDESGDSSAIFRIWTEVVKIYDKLFSWYQDNELFHLIGFLVAISNKNIGSKAIIPTEISELFNVLLSIDSNDKIKEEVRKKVYKRLLVKIIKKEEKQLVPDNFKYEYAIPTELDVEKTRVREVLLFSNIYSLLSLNDEDNKKYYTRFPFKLFHRYGEEQGWDIEHISPKNLEVDLSKCESLSEFIENIKALKDDAEDDGTIKKHVEDFLKESGNSNNYKELVCYSELIEDWKRYADEINQSPDHALENLVLLNSSINRSYGNAFFNKKRIVIIANDRKGVFIPICTRNVFMKYYSDKMENLTRWTDSDKYKYKQYLEEMFRTVKGWK